MRSIATRLVCFSVLVCTSFWGCGSDDNNALRILTSMPTDGANAVEPSAPIIVVFSKPIAADTVTSTSFAVSGPGGALAGNLSVDGATVTFAPSDTFALLAPYTITLTTDIHANDQTALPAAQMLKFTTRDGIWSDAVDVANPATQYSQGATFSIVVDSLGAATLAWCDETDHTGAEAYTDTVKTAYTTDGKAWTTTQHTNGAKAAYFTPLLAADGIGHVHLVWSDAVVTQLNANSYSVNPEGLLARRATAGVWESAMRPLAADQDPGSDTALVAGLDGNAYLSWSKFINLKFENTASRFDGSAWSAPTSPAIGYSGTQHLAPLSGEALVAWSEPIMTNSAVTSAKIQTERFRGETWMDAGVATTSLAYGLFGPQDFRVATNGQSVAFVVFPGRGSDSVTTHFNAVHTTDGGWSSADILNTLNDSKLSFESFELAASRFGRAVTFTKVGASDTVVNDFYANVYDGAHWSDPVKLASDPSQINVLVGATIDDAGNAFAAWYVAASQSVIYVARYSAATNAWSAPLEIQALVEGTPHIASNAKGQAYVAWSERVVVGNTTTHKLAARAFR